MRGVPFSKLYIQLKTNVNFSFTKNGPKYEKKNLAESSRIFGLAKTSLCKEIRFLLLYISKKFTLFLKKKKSNSNS